jgi:hypothetical protein
MAEDRYDELRMDDRVWVPDGRGTVLAAPDSEGRVVVDVDPGLTAPGFELGGVGGVVIFGAEEVRKFTAVELADERAGFVPQSEQRSILFVPEADTDDRASQAVASANLAAMDIVVGGNGGIIKDRHGDSDVVLLKLRAALATDELRALHPHQPRPDKYTLLGVALSEIAGLTIDGTHWFEVMGSSLRRSSPLGGPVLTFRIAQAPGGKGRKLGIGQGDVIRVREIAVCGIQRKGGEVVGLPSDAEAIEAASRDHADVHLRSRHG